MLREERKVILYENIYLNLLYNYIFICSFSFSLSVLLLPLFTFWSDSYISAIMQRASREYS